MSAGEPPRIGITTGAHENIAEYERAVRAAGGEPIRLAPDSERVAADVQGLDGAVLSGGDDVDPAFYGQAAHPKTEIVAPRRDAYELRFVREALDRQLPTLAICRGLQITNVAFGGTLYQHVPDAYGERVSHRFVLNDVVHRGLLEAHVVTILPDSRLYTIVGSTLVTGSRHHQAVDRVAEPFRVVARSEDGVVEAVERRDAASFFLGVQWHPESTLEPDRGAELAIFAALIAAARQRLVATRA